MGVRGRGTAAIRGRTFGAGAAGIGSAVPVRLSGVGKSTAGKSTGYGGAGCVHETQTKELPHRKNCQTGCVSSSCQKRNPEGTRGFKHDTLDGGRGGLYALAFARGALGGDGRRGVALVLARPLPATAWIT